MSKIKRKISTANHFAMNHIEREKLFSLFNKEQAIVYIRGAEVACRYGTDYEYPFRQESNFWYLSGVDEPDFHLILDLNKQEYHLFAPKHDAQYAVWYGKIRSKDQIQSTYKPDYLYFDSELPEVLKSIDAEKVYCLNEQQAKFLERFDHQTPIDLEVLSEAITYCRVFKTGEELDKMREAARVNNIAHCKALERLKSGLYEYELKAIFDYYQIKNSLMQPAYTGIFGSGPNSAIMHYVENTRKMEDGDLLLIDAGFEYQGYASDFTRTYPVNGTFTNMQAAVYEAVLEAQKQVIEKAVPEIEMEELHMLAARVMMQGLKDADIVTGSIDDLLEKDVFALFFPHGLGHFLGLDTHDVGGYPKGVDKINRPGLKYLRTRRNLQPDMVITIEPGLYFIPALLKPALEDERAIFLNKEKITPLMDFGGVRIEDNIIITDDGNENLADIPKEREEIEQIMASSS